MTGRGGVSCELRLVACAVLGLCWPRLCPLSLAGKSRADREWPMGAPSTPLEEPHCRQDLQVTALSTCSPRPHPQVEPGASCRSCTGLQMIQSLSTHRPQQAI